MARMMAKSNGWMLGLIFIFVSSFGTNHWALQYLPPEKGSLSGNARRHINSLLQYGIQTIQANEQINDIEAGSLAGRYDPNAASEADLDAANTSVHKIHRFSNTLVYTVPRNKVDDVNVEKVNVLAADTNCMYLGINGVPISEIEILKDPYWQYYADCDRWDIVFADNILFGNDAKLASTIAEKPETVCLPFQIDSNSVDSWIEYSSEFIRETCHSVDGLLENMIRIEIRMIDDSGLKLAETFGDGWHVIHHSILRTQNQFELIFENQETNAVPVSNHIEIPFAHFRGLYDVFSQKIQWAQGQCNDLSTELSPEMRLVQQSQPVKSISTQIVNEIQGEFSNQIEGIVVKKLHTVELPENILRQSDSPIVRDIADTLEWIASRLNHLAALIDQPNIGPEHGGEPEKVAKEPRLKRLQ